MHEISKAQTKYKNDDNFKKVADAIFNLLDSNSISVKDLLLLVSYAVTIYLFKEESE
jgi:hypothetical protein